uniref:Uncharacterized protein n=1 Tax=Tanacetum cinerariifolium TaxID=118510 RepID=A0A699HDK2_TANCI|nr:hypothetical protein [Tanacetum cinerariifolium]
MSDLGCFGLEHHQGQWTNPSVLVDQTKSVGDGLKTTHIDSGINEESRADEISKKIKLEDLSNLLNDTRSTFFTPDSLQDEHFNPTSSISKIGSNSSVNGSGSITLVLDDALEQQKEKVEAEVASLKARPSYSDLNQPTNLLLTLLKPKLSKLLSIHNFASCLPTELKELPSKFTKLSGEIKKLKKHVKDMEIELPEELKKIPTKLETFTSTISSLTSRVAELKNIQWELPAFATMVENASGATTKDVPSAGQATASPAEGEKNTKDAETNLQNELVDLLGIKIVEQYHKKKLLFDKYYDKMLKRRKSSKIINCDVLTQKGHILLKGYMEDGTIKVIVNFKVSNLHLAEWREVVQACPNRKEKDGKPSMD